MDIKSRYLSIIRQNCTGSGYSEHDLEYWKNKLFCTTIMYVLPLSLIAFIPGLYWIWHTKHWSLAVIDIMMVACVCTVAFVPALTLRVRKIIFVACAYAFSFALLFYVGLNGPGLTYLLACCIFSTLVFTNSYDYWPAWLNTFICILFWVIISEGMMPFGDARRNVPGEWIAVSVNLVFLSFLFSALVPRLFNGLQSAFEKEVLLKKELDLEKHRFISLFMEAPISMGVFSGPEHTFAIANQHYLELIGRTDVIGRKVREVLPEVIDQGIVDMLDKVYVSGESFSARETLVELEIDGKLTPKYLNFSCQPHRGRDQQVDSILFFAIDVTEQIHSRKLVEISESRLKEAQAIGKMGNWEVDLLSDKHYWSAEIYELFGIEQNSVEPAEDTFMAFVHPDDFEYAYEQINAGFKYLENIKFHFRYIRKDGTVHHGYNEWKFKFNEAGEAVQLTGILQDVTESHEAHQHAKDSESFSRGILDSLQSNIAVIDYEGNLIAVNNSWKHFGELNDAESFHGTGVGSNYFEVCRLAEIDGITEAGIACEGIYDVRERRKDIFYFEYPCHSPQEKRWFGMRVMRFEGKQPYLVIAHQNITERKLVEFERTKVAHDLIRRNKDLEQFTYIVSHNLRSPVANILGLLNIWMSPGLAEEEKASLSSSLYESVNKLDDVVKDLNQILQVRGEMNEKKELIQFSQLVEDIKVSIKSLIDLEVIEIQYNFDALNSLESIRSFLYSIFYNLITNSIKYRQVQIPCFITIKSEVVDDLLILTFTDNSMGIDLNKRGDQVFGLYKRFHSHVEGKGLGLFMVKTQVEKLGGRISVTSEVNKGTEFRIEFEL